MKRSSFFHFLSFQTQMKELHELHKTVQEYGTILELIKKGDNPQKILADFSKLKIVHAKYLEIKAALKTRGYTLDKNESVKLFKEYHEEFYHVQRRLLKEGVDLKNNLVKTNTGYLETAITIEKESTDKLKNGLILIQTTKETGTETLRKLEEDKQQIIVITSNLDEVEGELQISNRFITRFVKRLATDKLFIALLFLVVIGCIIAGLIAGDVIKLKKQ